MLDDAETRGFASNMPNVKKVEKRLVMRDTLHGSRPNLRNVTPTTELCPRSLTFRIKVRARKEMRPKKKSKNNKYTYCINILSGVKGGANEFKFTRAFHGS